MGSKSTMVRTVAAAALKVDSTKYEEAVKTLNTLQSNAQTLEQIRQERDKRAHLNIPRMLKYAERIGIQEEDVDRLNVIHVSGTKGKGSTCAFCESLLRHHGYRTGFFSSPHLVEVRERFTVDGVPLGREMFASYFWDVYNKLDKTKAEHEGMMPNYFGFLTVMALHVFLQEEVDVAIMEVGIGGQYDCTNMVRNPVVCGVSSLGLDHTSILGISIDKIAWHKAGIFKPGVPAFTVPQCPTAMHVLEERASEIGSSLSVCPDINTYGANIKLGISGSVQALNASLGLQLCNAWIQRHEDTSSGNRLSSSDMVECDKLSGNHSSGNHSSGCNIAENNTSSADICDIKVAKPFNLTQRHFVGLEQCRWLGRNQTIKEPGCTFYLDGAHTLESIEQCVDWFSTEAKSEKSHSQNGVHRVLIFNTTGDRDMSSLLKPLQSCEFDAVLFCPNIAYQQAMSADQTNNTVTKESQLKRCISNQELWERLCSDQSDPAKTNVSCNAKNLSSTNRLSYVEPTKAVENVFHSNQASESQIMPSISHCINWVCEQQWKSDKNGQCANGDMNGYGDKTNGCVEQNGSEKIGNRKNGGVNETVGIHIGNGDLGVPIADRHVQVLITGSLHLVGGALRVLWDRQS